MPLGGVSAQGRWHMEISPVTEIRIAPVARSSGMGRGKSRGFQVEHSSETEEGDYWPRDTRPGGGAEEEEEEKPRAGESGQVSAAEGEEELLIDYFA